MQHPTAPIEKYHLWKIAHTVKNKDGSKHRNATFWDRSTKCVPSLPWVTTMVAAYCCYELHQDLHAQRHFWSTTSGPRAFIWCGYATHLNWCPSPCGPWGANELRWSTKIDGTPWYWDWRLLAVEGAKAWHHGAWIWPCTTVGDEWEVVQWGPDGGDLINIF
jgi:hypothetical protein